MKHALAKLKSPSVALPLVAGLGLLWAASRGVRHRTVPLTTADGSPVVIRGRQVFALHVSPYEASGRPLVRLHVSGLSKPVDVRESLLEVMHRLGGDWVRMEAVGSWLGCNAPTVPVFLDATRVISVDTSGMRRVQDLTPLTEVQMADGFKIRVTEDLPQACRLLGM